MKKFKLRYIFLSLLFLLLNSCNECNWKNSGPLNYPFDTIWNTSYKVLNKRYNIIKASKDKQEIETDWRIVRSLHYLEGYRDKVFLKIEDYKPSQEEIEKIKLENKEDILNKKNYVIKICVLQEENRNIENPYAKQEAEWYPHGNDENEAMFLLNLITTKLKIIFYNEEDKSQKDDEKNIE